MRNKPDYARKSALLRSGLVQTQREITRAYYASYALRENGEIIKSRISIERADELQGTLFSIEDWNECTKINHASFERVTRLKDRVTSLLTNGQCLFLTLTFTDEILTATTAETRRQYVRKFLKRYGAYVGNIDFGKEKGREHYHALIQAEKVDYSAWHKYGGIKGEKVRYNPTTENADDIATIKKLSRYVAKLTNHAIKETTKRCALIYSR